MNSITALKYGSKIVESCDTACPVAAAATIFDGKWTSLIFRDLLSGTKRYSELQRSLTGISPRMLAARLSMLEEKGLISKTIYPTVPPKTEYTLTESGRRAQTVILAMAEFGSMLNSRVQAGVSPPRKA